MIPALLWLVACGGPRPVEAPDFDALPPVEQARVELGHALFFDPSLSADGTVSCATCHQPEHGGAEPTAVSTGVFDQQGRRNAPSVWSASLNTSWFWDGRADSLSAQAQMPLLAHDEMGADEATVLDLLATDYGPDFAAAFPDRGEPDLVQFGQSLAAYQRMLVAPGRVDAYLLGDRGALTDLEVRGLRRFRNNCAFCHSGEGVGGDGFEVLGDDQPWPRDRREDLGRFELTGNPADTLVFRVPSLRHAASTPPYFHDGSVPDLREAVRLMGWHQLGERLSEGEIDELVAFLEALDGAPADRWRLPPDPTDRGPLR